LNLINCLNYLPDEQKPHIVLFYGYKEVRDDFTAVEYPYQTFLRIGKEMNLIERIVDKVYRAFGKKSVFSTYSPDIVSFIYPFHSVSQDIHSLRRLRKVYWIPDFQEKYYPDFFSAEETSSRDERASSLAASNALVIFSSQNAMQDYRKFYPGHKNRTGVLNFASILPPTDGLDIKEVKEKFAIDGDYFISPNQFWVHKNHRTLLQACLRLKQENRDFRLVLTGKESDYRFPAYTQELKDFVKENGLGKNVRFLGYIDRKEQLVLIKHSIAVIQPSLFEGWSTVVEDCKALNCPILLADIPVHREQNPANVTFFPPTDADRLANIMNRYINDRPAVKVIDYTVNIRKFAADFLRIETLLK
jgi:glycosyltransferase involved in cell wall biosynthesis